MPHDRSRADGAPRSVRTMAEPGRRWRHQVAVLGSAMVGLGVGMGLVFPAFLEAMRIAPPYVKGGCKDDGSRASKRETVTAGLHKARVMQPKVFTPDEVKLSREWLLANGWRVPA